MSILIMFTVDAFQSFLNSLIIYSIVCSKKINDRNKLAFLEKDYAIYLTQEKHKKDSSKIIFYTRKLQYQQNKLWNFTTHAQIQKVILYLENVVLNAWF